MKGISWDSKKNDLLRQEREMSFEEVIVAVHEGNILDILEHKNKQKFAHQKILVVNIHHYAYLVPFIENEEEIFLKTIIPSRKATKAYIITKQNKKI